MKTISRFACVVLAGIASSAFAQTFPSKQVQIIIPFAAGGVTDLLGRLVAEQLQKQWGGEPVIVENRPGAGSIIGTEAVAKAKPDGHTLLLSGQPLSTFKVLFKQTPFDVLKDLAPLTQMTRTRYILYTSGAVPARSLKELIEYAKANPAKLNHGGIGPGGVMLAHEQFKRIAGVNIVQVPYKGAFPVSALLTNEVQMYLSGSLFPQTEVDGGRLKILAVTGKTRLPHIPSVPTFGEAGLPQFEAYNWQGWMTRAGTPPAIVTKLNEALVAGIRAPQVRERIVANGTEVVTSTPAELRALIERESKEFEEIARFAGIKPE
jgi:tripartite-type tricarboxylate transporter receptor subunit TctC